MKVIRYRIYFLQSLNLCARERETNLSFVSLQLIIELRPRLGSANAFYKTSKPVENVLITADGHIILNDSSFAWPSEYGQISSESLHNVTKIPEGGITFRLRFKNANFSLLNSGQSLKVQRKFRLPCGIPSSTSVENSKCTIVCASCKNEFKEIQVKRFLPLPSIDWKDEVQDWFCGCHHPTKKECSLESNRNLHTKGVAPRQSDLLYSSGFVRFYYPDQQQRMATTQDSEVKKAQVSCDKCLAPLGTFSVGEKMMHVWHHTVIIMSEKIDKLPLSSCQLASETFLMVIGGICSEHDWIPLKIRLMNDASHQPKLSLFIWMLEPDLKLLSTDEKSSALGAKSVLKVMFRQEIEDGNSQPEKLQSKKLSAQVDQELEIPLSVLKAGLETLEMSMEWIAPHQRQDSDFSIGYIDLSPVIQ